MSKWDKENIEKYSKLFTFSKEMVGKRVTEVRFYLEPTDKDFSEQPNPYGKSLFNGIDLKLNEKWFSIGNRFSMQNYGLEIDEGKTEQYEFVEESKTSMLYNRSVIKNQVIYSVYVYWLPIPWNDSIGYYPQEIEFRTNDGKYMIVSSLEINAEEANTEFTDEVLVIENSEIAKKLRIGPYGDGTFKRKLFSDFNELKINDESKWP